MLIGTDLCKILVGAQNLHDSYIQKTTKHRCLSTSYSEASLPAAVFTLSLSRVLFFIASLKSLTLLLCNRNTVAAIVL